jgi:hypothetical protein
MRPERAKATEPEIALQATSAIEIAVMISGDKERCVRIRTGTKINPPPAPINVPSTPIMNPANNKTKKLSIAVFAISRNLTIMLLYFYYFSFR